MLKSIMLLIKKDLFGRQKWVIVAFIVFSLTVFPVLLKQPWNYSPCFLPICYMGLVFAFSTAYGEAANVFYIRYHKAGIIGMLPITRLEIIISRYVITFFGIALASALWGLFSVLEKLVMGGGYKVYDASATMIVLSMLLAAGISNVLLLLASAVQNTKGMYLLSGGFFFFLTIISNIITWILGQFRMNALQLVLTVAASVGITIFSAILNYTWFKKQTI
ncbi:MAG: ABC-2 transporter permease [Clostridia bacterium]|nr:ABC-2 transporter permease [Clostridia bacterium]